MKSFFKLHRKATVCAAVVLVLAVTAAIAMPRLFKPDNIAQGSAKPNAIRLSKMNLAKSVSATGTLESSNSKTVTANVNNISVKKVLVTAGDAVKKGDELVVFDESDLKDAAEEAQQNLEDARSEAARSVLSARNKLSDAQETFAEEKEKQAKKAAEAKSEKSRAEKQVSKLKRQFAAAGDANERAKLSEQLAKAEEAIAYGVIQERTVTLFYFLLAFSHSATGVLRGCGKSVIPMVTMLGFWCGIRVLYVTVAIRIFPVFQTVCWAYPITWSLSSMVFLWFLLKTDWVHAYEK